MVKPERRGVATRWMMSSPADNVPTPHGSMWYRSASTLSRTRIRCHVPEHGLAHASTPSGSEASLFPLLMG